MIAADSAYVMTQHPAGRPESAGHGRARRKMASHWPLAGKTGTVDNNTMRFIGFRSRHHCRCVDRARRQAQVVGSDEQGAKAALPMWMDIMQAYIASRPKTDTRHSFNHREHRVRRCRQVDRSRFGTGLRARSPRPSSLERSPEASAYRFAMTHWDMSRAASEVVHEPADH